MRKITAEMWEKAIAKLNGTIAIVQERRNGKPVRARLYDDGWLHILGTLQDRYDDGERSIELYNAIMELC